MQRTKLKLKRLVLLAIFAGSAAATVTAEVLTTGSVSLVSSPPSVELGVFTSDTTIALIREQRGVALAEPGVVDVGATSGVYGESSIRPVAVPTGTVIDSYLFHFDPVGSDDLPVRLSGTVVFDRPVVGLIFSKPLLDASDFLGDPNTVYPRGSQRQRPSSGSPSPSDSPSPFRGFEFGSPTANAVADSVTLADDLRTVTVDFGARLYADQLRVLVEVPEPSALLQLLFVVLLLCCVIRRSVHRTTTSLLVTSRETA